MSRIRREGALVGAWKSVSTSRVLCWRRSVVEGGEDGGGGGDVRSGTFGGVLLFIYFREGERGRGGVFSSVVVDYDVVGGRVAKMFSYVRH